MSIFLHLNHVFEKYNYIRLVVTPPPNGKNVKPFFKASLRNLRKFARRKKLAGKGHRRSRLRKMRPYKMKIKVQVQQLLEQQQQLGWQQHRGRDIL